MADPLNLLSGEGLDAAKPVEGLNLLADPNAPGPFRRGFGAGVAGVKASFAGAGALAASAVGAKELEKAALDKAAAESEAASAQSMQFEDVVQDPSRAGEYFKWLLGNAVPSLATMAVGGGLGALAGRALASQGAVAAARAAGTAVPAVRAGAYAGAIAPDVALEAGGIYPEALKTGVENPALRAAAGGTLAASLDFLPLLAAERYLKAAGKGGFGAMAKGAAKGAPVGAVLEGAQEAGQSAIERAAAGLPLTGSEAISDYINSFFGGAAPGTVFGGVIGAHRGARGPVQETPPSMNNGQPPVVNAPPASTSPIVGTTTVKSGGKTSTRVRRRDGSVEIDGVQVEPPWTVAQEIPVAEIIPAQSAEITPVATVPDLRTTVPDLRTGDVPDLGIQIPNVGMPAVTPSSETPAAPVDHARNELMGNVAEFDSQVRENAADNADTVLAGAKQWVATSGVPESAFRQELSKKWRDDASPRMQELARAILGTPTTPAQAVAAVKAGFESEVPAATVLPSSRVTKPRGKAKTTEETEQIVNPTSANDIVKVDNTQPVTVDSAMALLAPDIKALAESQVTSRGAQKKRAANLTTSVREIVEKALSLPAGPARDQYINGARQVAILSPLFADKGDLRTFIKDVNASVGKGVLYSKGAVDLPTKLKELDAQIAERAKAFKAKVQEITALRAALPDRYETEHPVTGKMELNLFPSDKAKIDALDVEADAIQTELYRLGQTRALLRGNTFNSKGASGFDAQSVIQTLAKIEGARWASEQAASNREYGVNHVAQKIVEAQEAQKQYPGELLIELYRDLGGNTVIYGAGGYNRYQIQPDLSIKPIPESFPNKDTLKRAQELLAGTQNSSAALTSDQFHALPRPAQEAAVDTYNAIMAAKGGELIARLKALVGDWPGLIAKTFTAEPGSTIGSYTRTGPLKAVISMALNAKNELSIADHEGFHAAEDLVLNGAERQIVANAFKPGRPLFEKLMASVRRYDVENKTRLADEVSSIPAEARAYGFEFWRRGELQAEGALQRVFAKILAFFERIANAVRGLGFQSLEDVFTALDRGQFAEREKNQFSGLQGFDSRSARAAQTESPQFKAWFGDSKVVDKDGKPLVVKHVSYAKNIRVFRHEIEALSLPANEIVRIRQPIWFTDSDAYINALHASTGYVTEVFLALQKPLDMRSLGESASKTDIDAFYAKRGIPFTAMHEWDTPIPMHDEPKSGERIKVLESLGYDGIILSETLGSTSYIAFHSTQIKSAIGNNGAFDPSNPDITKSVGGRQEWYRSALTDQVTALNTKQASAQGWKDQIKGLVAKGLVKQVEIDAVGLNEFLDLQQGKVTKDQVTAFLRENGVRVEETTLGVGRKDFAERIRDAAWELADQDGKVFDQLSEAEQGDYERDAETMLADMPENDGETEFDTYQLPGGQNYRELLLTLPEPGSRMGRARDLEADLRRIGLTQPMDDITNQDVRNAAGANSVLVQRFMSYSAAKRGGYEFGYDASKPELNFRSTHFDQPNILSHIRFNERVDSEGKRVLFVEELQSDWAQKGKKEGFGYSKRYSVKDRNGDVRGDFGSQAEAQAYIDNPPAALRPYLGNDPAIIETGNGGIPSAPFISSQKFGVFKENTEMNFDAKADIAGPDEGKPRRFGTMAEAQAFAKKYSAEARDLGQQPDTAAWVGLSLKRVIRYAAENGFDKVAWTSGEQQVERYRSALRKEVDRIEWTKTAAGVQLVGYKGIGARRPGEVSVRQKVVDTTEKESALSDSIGKAMADRIKNDPAEKGVIEGEDITVSDTGMAGFYDKIVPSVANEVLRKLGGGKVGEVALGPKYVAVERRGNWEVDQVYADGRAIQGVAAGGDRAQMETTAIKMSVSAGASVQPGFTITPEMATRAAAGLPLFSKGALTIPEILKASADMTRRMQAGELEQIQQNREVTRFIEQANSEPWKKTLSRVGLKPEVLATKGGLSRWWMDWMSTPNFISAFSQGFSNAYHTLNNFLTYRTVLVERMLKERIPEWYTASFSDQDVAIRALLKRSLDKYTEGSREYTDLLEPLSPAQKRLFRQATEMIAGFINAEFEMEKVDYKEFLTSPGAYETWLADRAQQVETLKKTGYVPFRRYGDHTVRIYKTITDKDGQQRRVTAGLEMFTSEDQAVIAETIYKEEAARQNLPYEVERGIKQRAVRETAPSARQFLDTLRRQGVDISQEERERLVLTLTGSDAIIRNRLLHREGIPGFSTDGDRILNEFGVNMASKLAYSKFASAIDAAAEGRQVISDVDAHGSASIEIDYRKSDENGQLEPIEEYKARNLWTVDGPKSGYYYNRAVKLFDSVIVPNDSGEWSRNLRAAGMNYFIGGSIAGGMVNVMSIPMLLVPQLSVHTDYTNAATTTLGAWTTTWRHQAILRDITRLKNVDNDPKNAMPEIDAVPGLRAALAAAADKLQDTEIHQIMGISQGELFARSRGLRRAMNLWMSPFRITEQTNRITSFIAGYKIGQKNGLTGQALFKFARDMVDSTQNNYSLSNRPGIASTSIGSMLFMFKSFPLFMIEAAVLMYKASPRSAMFMLLGLTMMTGVQGLPFAEAIENLIDTIAQQLFNSPFNTRRAMRNILKDASEAVVGYDLSEIAMRGLINEVLGVSVSSRIGAGDFVPGSRLGTADADAGRVYEQLLGAPLSMVKDALSNIGKLTGGVVTGDWKQAVDALRSGGPIAIRNAIKGAEQLDTGFAFDSRGRKIKDVNTVSAILQLGGLAPAGVAKAYEFESINVQTKAFYNQVSQDLQHQTIQAMREGDTQKLQEISDFRNAWNKDNPFMPLMPNPAALRRAAMLADMPMDRRSVILWGRRLGGANFFREMDTEGM